MLKALELVGFKSFADKTRFEFPPGITVVVGPNGSGKSNIVDAMKWVLGAQSAKSLRGQDMADVIFKGSSEGARKMLNAAEATIVFENSDSRLPVEADEVRVTRRVYRSGEGEYLINGQACRLKDIRDLFRGTGVGTDAYSLIEQGKVDRMLQASAKDRRAMFEEAAGISRFKAKKLEAERRLERVEQNLLRLSDIVDEVENRVRTVRSQASKARRYREYADRLQQLRTHVGLTDWRRQAERLREIENQLLQTRDQSARLAAESEALEASSLELDVEMTNVIESARVSENQLARIREQMAVREAADEQARANLRDLEELTARHRRQLAAMTGRVGDLQSRLRETTTELQTAQTAYDAVRQRVQTHGQSLQTLTSQLEQLRGARDQLREQHAEHQRKLTTLGNRISGVESQCAALREVEDRSQQRFDELQRSERSCSQELEQAESEEQSRAREAEQSRRSLELARNSLGELRRRLDVEKLQLHDLRNRESSVRERSSVLTELEKSHEGLAAGVRDVLQQAAEAESGPFGQVQGLVADLLRVDVDIAPLIDIALGDRAQHVVLSGDALLDEIRAGSYRPLGRVGFLFPQDALAHDDGRDLQDEPGVVGRADDLVSCGAAHRSLKQRVLGDTWLVESLPIALALQTAPGRGCRFVTTGGELLERDGTLVVGPKLNAWGLVSRRSELRELKAQLEQLDLQLQAAADQVISLSKRVETQEKGVAELESEHQAAAASLAERQVEVRALRERRGHLRREQAALAQELQQCQTNKGQLQTELERERTALAELEQAVAAEEAAIREVEQRLDEVAASRDEHAREATAAEVELARSEQNLEALRARMVQFEEDHRERERAIQESRQQLADSSHKLRQTTAELLRTTSELAELCLRKESLAAHIHERNEEREALTEQRNTLANTLQMQRRKMQTLSTARHEQELAAGEVRHQRQTLADRLREDYGIELSEVVEETSAEQQQEREEVEREIDDLRRKLNNIGPVNMEALNELDDLDARFTSLSSQHQDLVQAKESLERIIQKINADSRRLFEETLEIIRANFQSLYRKAFGGGRADLVLEEGVDVLEAGVEIIATPPGKPSFSNSLLSGGEKALTAVALLLAIFQYRPSPFCVLDEVDAPFDEANIGRFIDVLRGFLDWTKFVIVTHSKKTMTAATTLYGVTMQESGVSKRVSVRFEDVSEDGHISQDAVARSEADAHETDNSDDERGAA